MSQKRAFVNCVCCGARGAHFGRGLVKSCYHRHHHAKTLDRWPLRPGNTPWIPTSRWALNILARYKQLLAANVSVKEIRWELSLTERSVQRYEAARRHLAATEAAT